MVLHNLNVSFASVVAALIMFAGAATATRRLWLGGGAAFSGVLGLLSPDPQRHGIAVMPTR
jgi:hypothetical protein